MTNEEQNFEHTGNEVHTNGKEKSMSEKISENIESELSQLKIKERTFDNNLESIGGEKGLQEKWNLIDQSQKDRITDNIKNFNKKRSRAIFEQGIGLDTLNPKKAHTISKELWEQVPLPKPLRSFFSGLTTLIYVPAGLTVGSFKIIRGTLNRLSLGMKLIEERKKL